ncbi:MAG: C69 family dipeptidase, partial [Olsenella umbonata]|nr:C69 family dipeptidase [Parafannyhessea umbonata]
MRKTHPGLLGRFTRFGRAMTVAAAIVMAMPTGALACTQIYMGKGVTDTGNTYVGRSEDYANRHPKAFGIQEPRENPTFSSDESNFEWTFKGTTYRYTYVRDLPSGWDNR